MSNQTTAFSLEEAFNSDKNLVTRELSLICILLKVAVVCDIVFEVTSLIYEVWRLHTLERQNVDIVVRLTEEKKRQVFGCRYLTLSLIWLTLLCLTTYGLIMVVPQRECLSHQALYNTAVCVDCQ